MTVSGQMRDRVTISQLGDEQTPWVEAFRRDGCFGPVDLMTPEESWALLLHLHETSAVQPDAWYKNLAPHDHMLHWHVTRPPLVAALKKLLGPDIILSGAHVITRPPGETHPWHTDTESHAPDSRFVTVWLGLDNTCRESAMQVISRSHILGKSVQQVRSEKNRGRGQTTTEDVLNWAREIEPEAELVWPDIGDGQALLLDGRTWHTTENLRARGSRSALVLQYAAADMRVRIPEEGHFDWPFAWNEDEPRPVIRVCGKADETLNHVVGAPAAPEQDGRLTARVVPFDETLGDDPEEGWKARHLFDGRTVDLDKVNCHVSVLSPGHCPHTPHAHEREEVLMVLDGEAEIVLADSPDGDPVHVERLEPGSVSYYPGGQHHTIRNASDAPVTYLMIDWIGPARKVPAPMAASVNHPRPRAGEAREKPFDATLLFEGETKLLRKLHCHVTDLEPDNGYAPHRDSYHVAIVVLSGMLETGGRVLKSRGVAFFPAGEPHGMWNIGTEAARYLVFEFHGKTDTRLNRVINAVRDRLGR